MKKHERIAALSQSQIDELERRNEQLTAELDRARQLGTERSILDAATNALLGELEPAEVVETAQRCIADTMGRPCAVVEGSKAEAEAVIHGSIALCKPLENEDGPLGWLCLGGPEPSTEEHLLAEELARRVSRALVAAHTVVNRSQTFRTLERSLLPDALLPLPGLQLASRYLPATGSHDVGGDFYDAVRRGNRITLIVGDVQGKGVEAATLTSLARHTLRAGALSGRDPAALLAQLNTALLYGQAEQLQAGKDPVLRFVTAAVASIERTEGGFTARVARAGQPPPVVVRSAGSFQHLEPKGVLLGVCEDPEFEEATVDMAVGDTLILYTDGVIEHRDSARAFSERHLGMLVRNRRNVVDAEATAQLIEDTVHLVASENVRDDVAILVACAVPTAGHEDSGSTR